MNWTSTRATFWEIVCDHLRRRGRPFALRGVSTIEHERFVREFCEAHGWTAHSRSEDTVFLLPTQENMPVPELEEPGVPADQEQVSGL